MSRLGDYEKIKRSDVLVLFVGSLCTGYPIMLKEKKKQVCNLALRIPVNLGATPFQLVET